jgi:ABC-type branched-subunit amino acid transport system ATPase component
VTDSLLDSFASVPETAAPRQGGLRVRGLRVAYGGNVAVDNVSFEAPIGRITGLIGPNGAGKTTTFNACNGLVPAARGRISLFGTDVTRRGAAARARLGLGRTFQQVQVCAGMTVADNVALGAEIAMVGRNPFRQFLATRSERRAAAERTRAALATCGIEDIADRQAAVISTGQRRLLELARVLAGDFALLLLDEPSSGLDEHETEQFGAILSRIVADGTRGALLIEHDMALVMSVCDYIHVLDFGTMIFEGTPDEVRASEAVRKAYLGEEPVDEAASP